MVPSTLHPHPHRIHQMHVHPHGGRDLGPLQELPTIPRTQHPHGLEHPPHHRATRRMTTTLPSSPTTHHHPAATSSAGGSPRRTRPHGRLQSATRPRRRPTGHNGTIVTHTRHQGNQTTHTTASTCAYGMQPHYPRHTRPRSSNSYSTSRNTPAHPLGPPQAPRQPSRHAKNPHAHTPPVTHNTYEARTGTTSTTRTPAGVRVQRTTHAPTTPYVHR